MTRSNIPTDYIILPAYTNSELESCDFAVVYVPSSYREELAARLALLQPLMVDQYFSSLSFWDAGAEYCTGYGEDKKPILEDNDSWVYVQLTLEQLEELPRPEDKLDMLQLTLTPGGSAYFSAVVPHSGVEYWSGQFKIAELCGLVEYKNR